MSKVTFTPEAAKRIAKVVKRVEQTPQQFGGRNPASSPPNDTLWAIITYPFYRHVTAEGITLELADGVTVPPGNKAVYYSWVKAIPDPNGNTGFIADPDAGEGMGNARLINDMRGPIAPDKPFVPANSVVQLVLAGYDQAGDPLYVFNYSGPQGSVYSPIPVHDHRSNEPGYGGFSFSVYHPGHNLPMHPFAI